MKSSFSRVKNAWIGYRNRWLSKRIPAENSFHLNLGNTFILPSSFGWAVITIVLFLFILGTNYQNNIVLGMSYFFIALSLLSLFHSYAFFTQHTIEFLPFEAEFANRELQLKCWVSSQKKYPGGEINLSAYGQSKRYSLDHEKDKQLIQLPLTKLHRGLHDCERIKVETLYGFGIFRCWSYLQPKHKILVYPAIQKAPIQLHRHLDEDESEYDSANNRIASDNLQGIRSFIDTDPLHHVSWKHVAKGQGLMTKDYTQSAGLSGWIRLSDFGNGDEEMGLRILSYQAQQLYKDNAEFGIDLGVTKILPQTGFEHLQNCLYRLATHGQSPKLTEHKAYA
jgi:uncharacterized protein (DUF58 family)